MMTSGRWTSLSLVIAVLDLGLATGCHDKAPDAKVSATDGSTRNVPLPPGPPLPQHEWSAEKDATHVLNRLAYGPRPGDIEAVKKAGVSEWIQAQLKPESLTDEAVAKRLRELPTLSMSTKDLLAGYPKPKQAPVPLTATGDRNAKAFPTGAGPTSREAAADSVEVYRELVAQKLLRAVGSEKQLQERLVDFWFNHFNVYVHKGQDLWMTTPYERDAIRPFVFGKFRQLLGATAHHPAMLYYLDNWLSKTGAINENYGRELLELHTLGVDGGYTQSDVTQAARVLTGLGIDNPGKSGLFEYRAADHDPGPETLLGKTFQGAGQDQSDHFLDLLAAHPATAKFVCSGLAEAFLSDAPSAKFVERLVKVYEQTGGDLHAVYEALFYAPEFWADDAYRAKTKTPLELAVSALRAVGAELDDAVPLAGKISGMGEPLYECVPPTGYKNRADAWIGTGALIARVNFGIALAGGRVKGVSFDREKLVAGAPPDDEGALADRLAADVLHETLSKATRDVIVREVSANAKHVVYQEPPPTALPQTLGLLLGSPEFQKR
jgi:uncharacterized protein (DUF1800 family)